VTLADKTLTLNGLPARYLQAGDPAHKTILFLHGGIGPARLHWEPALEPLADTYHVLALDLPGFGGTAALPAMTTTGLLDWIHKFLQQLGVEQVILVGNSFGCLLARLYAAAYPAQIIAVIFVNGGAVPKFPPVLGSLGNVPAVGTLLFGFFGRMAVAERTLNGLIHIKSVMTASFKTEAKQAASGFAGLMRMLTASPLPSTTPQAPVLILWGTEDTFAPVKDGKAVHAALPGSKWVEIADCGHMPQLEAPDVFVWQVETYLDALLNPKPTPRPNARGLRNLSG
jgi:pimeloyl-ACP methyl ester carboxylesterase